MAYSPLSPFPVPNFSHPTATSGRDELLFSDDPKFELHGEIQMLVVILTFTFFFVVVFFFVCSKRLRRSSRSPPSPEIDLPVNYSGNSMFKVQSNGGSGLNHQSEDWKGAHQSV